MIAVYSPHHAYPCTLKWIDILVYLQCVSIIILAIRLIITLTYLLVIIWTFQTFKIYFFSLFLMKILILIQFNGCTTAKPYVLLSRYSFQTRYIILTFYIDYTCTSYSNEFLPCHTIRYIDDSGEPGSGHWENCISNLKHVIMFVCLHSLQCQERSSMTHV